MRRGARHETEWVRVGWAVFQITKSPNYQVTNFFLIRVNSRLFVAKRLLPLRLILAFLIMAITLRSRRSSVCYL